MGDDSEWLKLPTEEKIQHKVWKARVAGYEEATKLFLTLEDRSPEYQKYLGLIKKMITDSNAIAQEKALDAVLAYVENAHVAGKTVSEAVSAIIAKCLNSSRTKTKEKGVEIILMYIEIEKQEIVQDELMKGLTNKQPKIVVVCIQALRQALNEFGMKTIMIKPMVKQLQRLLEDRDKNVREETKLLAVEIYRWISQALKPQLSNLKPVQVQELEAEFEKLPSGRPNQTRFLRSQQDLKAKMEEAAAAGEEDGDEEDEDAPADIDPFDLMDPVDILQKIPKDFYEKIEMKKWQERKEALSAVEKLVETPKIENGEFGDLVRALKKVITKDSNVMLVALASKVLLGLALGLRKKFNPYAVACIETILEKFKEKKITVITVLRECIDACFKSMSSIEPITEQCVTALGNKNPQIKAETALFLARAFSTLTMATLPKKLLKMFVMQLLKTLKDTAPEVREASFVALGTAMKVVGEKPIMSFLIDVEPIKMTKIKECCDKAVVVGKKSSSATAPAASAGVAAKAPAPAVKKEAPKSIRGGGGPKPSTKSGGAPKAAAKKGAATKGKKGKGAAAEENLEPAMSDEAVEAKCAELLPASVMSSLDSSNWKERLAAMEKFLDVVKSLPRSEVNCQAFVRLITKKPGLKETNFQVLKLKVELIGYLAQNANFSKRSAEYCLTELVDKVGDVKNGNSVQEALSHVAETCTLEYVSQQVIVAAFEQKNPKNQSEALNWLAQSIKEFGFKVNIKPMLQYIKKAFGATNPAIRTAAITLLGVVYMYMGQTLRVFFEDEKPALLQSIDAEFEKVKGEKPPPATRGLASTDADDDEDDDDDEEGGQEGINVADLVPRNNISTSITPELLAEMADKNWKVRAEALQKLTGILNEAKFITPYIGGLPEALKARLSDSNKILVNTTVSICQTLATAMGPKVSQHVKVIAPGIISVFGDTKPLVRAGAVGAANVWVEQAGLLPFVEAEIFSDALKEQNPNLRAVLLGWLAEKLPNYKKLPVELNMCIPHMFSCLEDRNATVRQNAQDALVPYMVHVGYDSMSRQAAKLKPSSKDMVVGHLEKAKAALPAKPVKAKAPKVAKVAPQPEVQPEPEDNDFTAPPMKDPVKPGQPGKRKASGKKAVVVPNSRKKEEDVDTSPLLKASNGKEQRMKDEKNLKVLKWNFATPRAEFVEQLRTQMEPTFNKSLMEQLFHADFKILIKAIEGFIKVVESDMEAMTANLDLVLRWLTLRFFETNTSVLLKALEFLQLLFNGLTDNDYHMIEFEAAAFIPYLINKVGDPKDNFRRHIRIIFKLVCKVYPASKMFSCLLEGLKPKNTKQKTECLEELGCLIESYGINVCQPSPAQALKLIASNIGTRDNSVRSAALNTVCVAYTILGESVYKYIGTLSDKDQGMLEERIKRYAKSRPATAPIPHPEEMRPIKTNNGRPATAGPLQLNRNSQNRANNEPAVLKPAAKKAFQLNLSEYEAIGPEVYDMPKLLENDIDDVLYDPIQLPKTRLRPLSPAMKYLSNDAKSAIDLVISQIASNDVITSIQALTQIDELLKDNEKADLMVSHVDQYVVVCVLQLRFSYSKQITGETTDNNNTIIRVYRCVLGSLLTMFRCRTMGKDASAGVLKDLFHVLITVLLDQRLLSLDEGTQVVRSVNVLTVNIVQRSEKTAVMSALLQLLHESIAMETCPSQFLELIMKCLWKLMRMLPDIVNEINVDRILFDIHNFLKAFPSQTWSQRRSDVPLRTIRTILHTLVKLLGNKIMGHLSMIDSSQTSEVVLYLQKILKTSSANSNENNALTNNAKNDAINGNEETIANNTPHDAMTPRSSKRLSKTTHDMLSEIFKKIGYKKNTREGLNDLYEFKKNYPDADLDPFLKKSSQFFQNYITRGLKNIELEREGSIKLPSSSNKLTPSSSSGSLGNGSNNASSLNGDIYDPAIHRKRLMDLQARFRLDNKPSGESEFKPLLPNPTFSHLDADSPSFSPTLSGTAQTEILNSKSETQELVDKAADDIVVLRKRLEMVRKGAASSS